MCPSIGQALSSIARDPVSVEDFDHVLLRDRLIQPSVSCMHRLGLDHVALTARPIWTSVDMLGAMTDDVA